MNLLSLKELSKLGDVLDEQDNESLQLLEAMKDFVKGISVIDEEGRYKQANPLYASICGYIPDEMRGMKWENTVDASSIDEAHKLWQDMVANNKSETILTGKKKDGTLFKKRVILYLKRDRNGKHNGHFCFMNELDN
jgi:PAS domain S-box-containing protein